MNVDEHNEQVKLEESVRVNIEVGAVWLVKEYTEIDYYGGKVNVNPGDFLLTLTGGFLVPATREYIETNLAIPRPLRIRGADKTLIESFKGNR